MAIFWNVDTNTLSLDRSLIDDLSRIRALDLITKETKLVASTVDRTEIRNPFGKKNPIDNTPLHNSLCCCCCNSTFSMSFFSLFLVAIFITMSTTTTALTTTPNHQPRKKNMVAIVGSANQDLTAYTSVIPRQGETVMGNTFETASGGKGANQARAAGAFCGTDNTRDFYTSATTMICRVGADVFGTAILDTLTKAGVQYDPQTTILDDKSISSGVATIVVDETTGDNSIIVTPGANAKLSADDVTSALQDLQTSTSGIAVLAVQLEIELAAAKAALQTAAELGATTILNTAPAPLDPSVLDDVWQYVDICIPNETELCTLCEQDASILENSSDDDNSMEVQLCQDLLRSKPIRRAVVCTLGARGAVVVERNNKQNDNESSTDDDAFTVTFCDAPADLPARHEPLQDTIGAGDAFCGALCSYLSANYHQNDDATTTITLPQAAAMACGFASMSVRRRGATYPTWEEIPESLKLKVTGSS